MLEIEIFSDVVCPWCFIGKRRLDRVLQSELGEGVSVRWRPYQLHPNMAPDGVDRVTYLQRRYGAEGDVGRVPRRIAEEAAGEGIELRYDLIRRMPNTLLAHRLLELADREGCQHAMAEALFQGYFCEGQDVGDLSVLVAIAESCGIPAAQTQRFLTSTDALHEVQTQLARALDIGVSGVPGYYLANGFLLPGAQTSETMAQILTRVKDKLANAS